MNHVPFFASDRSAWIFQRIWANLLRPFRHITTIPLGYGCPRLGKSYQAKALAGPKSDPVIRMWSSPCHLWMCHKKCKRCGWEVGFDEFDELDGSSRVFFWGI